MYMKWNKRFNEKKPDKEIERLIKKIYEEHKVNYGYRRIGTELRNCGNMVNSNKILLIMRKHNHKYIKFTHKSRKFSTYKGTIGKVAKNLINRRFYTNVPLQKKTTDTTEFKYYVLGSDGRINVKKAYLDPFLDMFNGEVLSYRLSKKPNAKAIIDALDETIERTKDCPYQTTIHSDQGWGYQMKVFGKKLKDNKIFQSMSRRGNCLDNSPIENFFGLMKQEM